MRQLDIELTKLTDPEIYAPKQKPGLKQLMDLPLIKIREYNPNLEKELRNGAFEAARNSEGLSECAQCGMTSADKIRFHVDHIVPMNKGGKSLPENLQILCRTCNQRKGDR